MSTVNLYGQIVNHVGRNDFWYHASRGHWEKETFMVIKQLVKPKSVFLDVGAWNGVFSLYAHKLEAVVHAIEPDPTAYRELCNNVLENAPANIYCHNLAISDHDGLVRLKTNGDFGNSESTIVNRNDKEKSVTVRGSTLATFCADHFIKKIGFIKMDIEGGEALVIPQAKEFYERYEPPMVISFHPAWLPDKNADIERFVKTLSPIYNIVSIHTMQRVGIEYFTNALHNSQFNHTFLFLPK
jgi:FkbM family methyltransferase